MAPMGGRGGGGLWFEGRSVCKGALRVQKGAPCAKGRSVCKGAQHTVRRACVRGGRRAHGAARSLRASLASR
eukprot:1903790-Prymnesium_polylepis.1